MTVFAVAWALLIQRPVLFGDATAPVRWWEVVVASGLLGAMWILRRSRPELFTVLSVVGGLFSGLAGALPLIGVFRVASRRPVRRAILVAAVVVASLPVDLLLFPVPHPGPTFAGGVLFVAATTGWGAYLRTRRELETSLRIALAAEGASARRAERLAVARDMHDALTHRLSLLAIHAEVLDSPDATVVREQARAALGDLRDVLGVLREDRGSGPREHALTRLVEEARAAGQTVVRRVELEITGLPDPAQALVFHVVREGLTNARRHAPGTPVEVRVSGDREDGVSVVIDSGPSSSLGTAGSRLGLVGLRERVAALGGRLDAGPHEGGFRLEVWAPWG